MKSNVSSGNGASIRSACTTQQFRRSCVFSNVVNAASETSSANTSPGQFSAINRVLKPDPAPLPAPVSWRDKSPLTQSIFWTPSFLQYQPNRNSLCSGSNPYCLKRRHLSENVSLVLACSLDSGRADAVHGLLQAVPRTEIRQIGLHGSSQKTGNPLQDRIPQQWIRRAKHALHDVVFLLGEYLQLERFPNRPDQRNIQTTHKSCSRKSVSEVLRHRRHVACTRTQS